MVRARVLAAVAVVGLALGAGSTAQAVPELQAATSDVTLHVEPDDAYAPLIDFIRSADETLDYNIYQFNDGVIARELKAAKRRGVDVRVIFTWQTFTASSNLWNSSSSLFNKNMPTFLALQKSGIKVQLSPFQYTYSHEKTMIADGHTDKGRALIMDFNAQPSYFLPTEYGGVVQVGARGFAVTTSNPADVSEIQEVFDADWERRAPKPYTSPRLVWSPSGVGYDPQGQGKERIFALIDGAEKTLNVYALLVDYLPFQDRLIAAAKRGVDVRLISTTNPASMTFGQLKQLVDAGVDVRFDPTYPGGLLFIHSKAIVRDAGTDNAMAFVGSQNPGDNVSLNSERELGILLGKPSIITEMVGIYDRDWEHSAPLSYKDGQIQDPFPLPRKYS